MRYWLPVLFAVCSLTACLGGPTARPAATDVRQALTERTSLEGHLPLIYCAIQREGNLELLQALTIGNRQWVPLLRLDTSGLITGELDCLGVDPSGFAILAGPQGKPRGSLQVVNLRSGHIRKAIGKAISEEPWTLRLYAPPQHFIADRPGEGGHLILASRYRTGGDVELSLPPDVQPSRYFGIDPAGAVLYAHHAEQASRLLRADPAAGTVTVLASFPPRLEGLLLLESAPGDTLTGFALTAGLGTEAELTLWRWRSGGAPQQLRSFPSRGTRGLVPPGWGITMRAARCVIAVPAGPGTDPAGAIYLVSEEGVVLTQNADADLAWLVDPGHLFWLQDGALWYRPLEAPESDAAVVLTLPQHRDWRCFPGTLSGYTPLTDPPAAGQ